MKGMILAAGLGTRMGPLSRFIAKPAVSFLGRPLIHYAIDLLRSADITDIVINLHHLPETVTGLLGDGSALGVRITYSYEDPLLGSGGGIGKVRDFFGGETFAVVNSDVIIEADLKAMIRTHRATGALSTMLLRPDPDGEYGKVLVDDEGVIRRIEGYPRGSTWTGGTAYMFAGVQVLEAGWFDYAPAEGPFETFSDVYEPLMNAGEKVASHVMHGKWTDLGSARRLLDATRKALSGNIIPDGVVIGERCKIEASDLSKSTRIGNDCRLKDVISIGDCIIEDRCHLQDCIICPGAVVKSGISGSGEIYFEHDSLNISTLRR